MPDRYSLDEIRTFWTTQARTHGGSPVASWSDTPVIDMEIAQIVGRLRDGDSILDVGCANGYSSASFALARDVRVTGVDYIPEMIQAANERRESLPDEARSRVDFRVGDATSLDFPDDRFDSVVVVRVIINLGEWSDQLRALRECARVLRPGGVLLLSEATVQGWRRLNLFRQEWGLADIPMPAFNNYLDEDRVAAALVPALHLDEVVDFASSYYVGTRILKPLLARALQLDLDVARPDMEWNRWFAQLPPAGDYGTQKLFVFRKG